MKLKGLRERNTPIIHMTRKKQQSFFHAVHPVAWIGLIADLALVTLVSASGRLDLGSGHGQIECIVSSLLFGAAALNLGGVLLLMNGIALGGIIGGIGGILLFPLGLVSAVGCFMTRGSILRLRAEQKGTSAGPVQL